MRARLCLGQGQNAHGQADGHGAEDCGRGQKVRLLEGDGISGYDALDRITVDLHVALVGPREPSKDAQKRGFAAARRFDDGRGPAVADANCLRASPGLQQAISVRALE